MIVHGIPDDVPRSHEGDIISIDCGAIVDGWHGDAAFTARGRRRSRRRPQRLIDVDRGLASHAGIAADGGRATASATSATPCRRWPRRAGFSVVREYVGHAIGQAMHEQPEVPNYGRAGQRAPSCASATCSPSSRWSTPARPDTVAARRRLERRHRRRLAGRPTVEHTIAITDDGPEILTAALTSTRARSPRLPTPAAGVDAKLERGRRTLVSLFGLGSAFALRALRAARSQPRLL